MRTAVLVTLLLLAGCAGRSVPEYGVLATETFTGEVRPEVDGRVEADVTYNVPRGAQRALAVLAWGNLVQAPEATLVLIGPDGEEVPHDEVATNGTGAHRSLSTTFEPVTQAPYTFRLRFDGVTTSTTYTLQVTVLGDRNA